jgi:hypothetical protein
VKLINTFSSTLAADEAALSLRMRGILTFISDKNSSQMGIYVTGTINVHLWVVIDEQLEDAIECLKDENYLPKNPLSEEEMVELEKESATELSSFYSTVNIFFIAFVIVVILILGHYFNR